MADSKPAGKPIADVSHPDKTPPSQTSRPVIITSRPVLKQQPSSGEAEAKNIEAGQENAEGMKSVSIKIKTLAETSAEAETDKPAAPTVAELAEQAKSTKEDQPATSEPEVSEDKAADETSDDRKSEDTKPETPAEESDKPQPETTEDNTSTDDDHESSEPDKGTDPAGVEAEAAKLAEHDAAIQKLIDSNFIIHFLIKLGTTAG